MKSQDKKQVAEGDKTADLIFLIFSLKILMTEIAGAKQNYQIKQRNNQLFQLFCTQLSKRNQRRLQKFDLELFSPNREHDVDCSTLSKLSEIELSFVEQPTSLAWIFFLIKPWNMH